MDGPVRIRCATMFLEIPTLQSGLLADHIAFEGNSFSSAQRIYDSAQRGGESEGIYF